MDGMLGVCGCVRTDSGMVIKFGDMVYV